MIDSAWQGAPFAIGNDGYLYFCSLDEWVKFPSPLDQVDQRFGELVKIAVLNTNNIWGIDSNGSIVNYSPSEFTEGWVVVCPPFPSLHQEEHHRIFKLLPMVLFFAFLSYTAAKSVVPI